MGRVRVNSRELSEFSLRVVANVERLRDEAGLSNSDLIVATGFSRNYYYTRMRYEAAFTTDDMSRLAVALNVAPAALTAESAHRESRHTRVDGRKLAHRLQQMVAAVGDAFSFEDLAARLHEVGVTLNEESWKALLGGAGAVRIPEDALVAIAVYFHVDPRYLLDARFDEVADRIEAELQLKAALHNAGVDKMSMRAFGEVSPDAIRAVARAIQDDN